jgi:hypothetical protein
VAGNEGPAGERPPILHIGYHKTGSSWLQKQLFPNARGVSLVPRIEVRREVLVPGPASFDPETARASLLEGRDGRLVISEEELSGNLHTGGLHGAFSKELALRLHGCFPEGRVVVFVRNQRTMITSAYKQYIKGGGTRRIEGFLRPSKAPHKKPSFELDFLAYDGLISHYESLFGRENVSVYCYEEFSADPRSFSARFARDLDLDLDLDAISTGAVNAGYRSGTLAVLRFLNLFHNREIPNASCVVNVPGFYSLLEALAPRIDRLPFLGRVQELEDYLPPDAVRRLEDEFRESNLRLEKSRALGLRELGYPLA